MINSPADKISGDDLDIDTEKLPHIIYDLVDPDGKKPYDVRELLASVVDKGSIDEYKAQYGKPLVTAYAKFNNIPVGVVASQRIQTTSGKGEVEIGGVLYSESADKAARFVMDCNQAKIPIIFFQDVMGFMVGVSAEQSGIIRSGAKLVNAISNSIVPKITVIVGSSFGAGNYALCGKAYDPNFILAWPNAKYAVMGADQVAGTLFTVEEKKAEGRACLLMKNSLKRCIRRFIKNTGNIWTFAMAQPAGGSMRLFPRTKLAKF